MADLQNSPKRMNNKKNSQTSSKKINLKKNGRFSENISYISEKYLEKSNEKIKIKGAHFENFHIFPDANYSSPAKIKKENSFNQKILESEKYPNSKYLILDSENDNDPQKIVFFFKV